MVWLCVVEIVFILILIFVFVFILILVFVFRFVFRFRFGLGFGFGKLLLRLLLLSPALYYIVDHFCLFQFYKSQQNSITHFPSCRYPMLDTHERISE